MTLESESSNLNIKCIITISILLMTMIDPFFIISTIYYNLWNIPLLAFHVFLSESWILVPLIWAQNIWPRVPSLWRLCYIETSINLIYQSVIIWFCCICCVLDARLLLLLQCASHTEKNNSGNCGTLCVAECNIM